MPTIAEIHDAAWQEVARLPSRLVPEIFEAVVEFTYRLVLRPGDWAVDVGAHRGRHTVPMARLVGRSGRVVAVEAAREMRPKLQAVLNRAGVPGIRQIVELHGVAAWESPGTADFVYVPEAAGMSGLRERDYPRPVNPETERVELARLDDLVAEPARVRFMKLDIEGAEYHALRGAPRILAEGRPVLALEFGNKALADTYGYGDEDFFGLFDSAGYELFTAIGTRLSHESWGRSAPYYLVALPREDGSAFERVLLPAVVSAFGREVEAWLDAGTARAAAG